MKFLMNKGDGQSMSIAGRAGKSGGLISSFHQVDKKPLKQNYKSVSGKAATESSSFLSGYQNTLNFQLLFGIQ